MTDIFIKRCLALIAPSVYSSSRFVVQSSVLGDVISALVGCKNEQVTKKSFFAYEKNPLDPLVPEGLITLLVSGLTNLVSNAAFV